MFNAKPIHDRFGDYICRRCVNRECNVNLTPPDCQYGYYYTCPCCGEKHHIVTGFTPQGLLKMLFKR